MHDGAEAPLVCGSFRPDVALLDIGLPGVDGYSIARRIREYESGRTVLIAVTGWGQPADRERSRQAGFDHHLVKPVHPGDLLKLIERTAAEAGRAGSPQLRAGASPRRSRKRRTFPAGSPA